MPQDARKGMNMKKGFMLVEVMIAIIMDIDNYVDVYILEIRLVDNPPEEAAEVVPGRPRRACDSLFARHCLSPFCKRFPYVFYTLFLNEISHPGLLCWSQWRV